MPEKNSILSSLLKPLIAAQCRLPQVDGEIRLAGLKAPVEVRRDHKGVPHIYAGNTLDTFYAQGFIHAQERLWQMEFNRRLVAGRLSEMLGTLTLPLDRWMRTLTMRRVAEFEVSLYDAASTALLQAYADGVNAFINQGPAPIEFKLIRHKPEPWIIADILAWVKMMAWSLSVNWEMELLRAKFIDRFGSELAAELEAPHLERWQYTIPPGSDFSSLDVTALERARSARPFTGPSPYEGLGSNNWVISGARSATGKPLLANDMHLALGIPAIWFENHLVCDEFNITGVTFPGIPGVIAGHNQHVAWGFTNGFPDVQDLYIEHLRTTDSGKVQAEYNGQWEEVRTLRETIHVKGAESVVEEVLVTRHGPVINKLSPDFIGETPLALRWTALDPDTMVQGVINMIRARNCAEFHLALTHWTTPCQNVVYADTAGDIAFTWPGKIPQRKNGDGRLPVPGWTDEYEWTGYIPYDCLPHLVNPPQGFIATANNRTFADDYPIDIPIQPINGDRLQRIYELIESNPSIDIEYIKKMQFDQVSTSAREILRHLRSLKSDDRYDEHMKSALNHLLKWDGTLAPDSIAAGIYQSFIRHMVSYMVFTRFSQVEATSPAAETSDLVERFMGKGPTPILGETSLYGEFFLPWLTYQLDHQDSPWFHQEGGEKFEDFVRFAIQSAVEELQEKFGDDELNWTWGKIHEFTFKHLMGSNQMVASFLNRGPIPLGGDFTTVWATGSSFHQLTGEAVIAPPFRMIVDLGDLDNSWGILTPGQSGIPRSPHYDDQIDDWLKKGYHRLLFSRDEVVKNTKKLLTLIP